MIEKTEVGEHIPDNGRVLLTCKNGKVSIRVVHDDEHVASLNALLELAEMAGFVVVKKNDTKL